jgi:hypothetical protein
MGTITALLLIKKHSKITPISLISSGADHANVYKIQSSNNLSLSALVYISKLGSTQFICGVMDKAVAFKFKILIIPLTKAFLRPSQQCGYQYGRQLQ